MSEPNTKLLLKNFERAVKSFKGSSKWSRLVRHPWKEVYSKLLSKMSKVSKVRAQTFYGEPLNVFLPETVSSFIYRYGFFEEGLTLSLLKILKSGDTFVDVGAHVGYFTLLASRLVGESGRVIAFEPTPRTRQVTEYNTKHRANVKIEPLAAWSNSNASLTLNDFGWIWSAYNSIFKPRFQQNVTATPIQVKCIALDEYFTAQEIVPSFVKIDAESAELEILKGMVQTLKTYHPVVSVEVGDFDLPDVPKSREIVEFVMTYGYVPFEYKAGAFVKHTLCNRYGYNNIIFVPAGLTDHFMKLFQQG